MPRSYSRPFGRGYSPSQSRSASRFKGRIAIGFVIAAIAVISYCSQRSVNPVTGKAQYVGLTTQEEVVLGLQAAQQMIPQFGGEHPDRQAQALVDEVGRRLLNRGLAKETPWQFDFHLLADSETINAFALPGGQVFITAALFNRLDTEGQLAGVLGHEIGHVLERHSAEQLAKANLTQGLSGAVGVAAGDYNSAAVARAVGQLINMSYGRDDELESDVWGVDLMADAGYDPRALIRVMEILAEASGPGRQPEFFSTHPNPENRIARIEAAIRQKFPQGVPDGLQP